MHGFQHFHFLYRDRDTICFLFFMENWALFKLTLFILALHLVYLPETNIHLISYLLLYWFLGNCCLENFEVHVAINACCTEGTCITLYHRVEVYIMRHQKLFWSLPVGSVNRRILGQASVGCTRQISEAQCSK